MTAACMDTIAGEGLESDTRDNPQTHREDIASISNSQISSLNDSATSQVESQHDPSINTSQTSVLEYLQFSSSQQSHFPEAEKNGYDDSRYGLAGGLISAPKKAAPSSTISANAIAVISSTPHLNQAPHGQKRMSNGHLKSPSIDSPTSPSEASFRGFHVRRLSSASSGSQVGELAAQLRTRLSYAMVKVQNGWQDRTIDEVESLASRQCSMAPPTPTPQQIQSSPSRASPYLEKTDFEHSSDRSMAQAGRCYTLHDQSKSPPKDHGTTAGQALLYPNPQPLRQQSTGLRNGSAYHGKHLTNQAPRLAPAFDVSPRDAQHVTPRHPPRLNTHNVSNLSNYSATSALSSNPPSTPPPRHSSLARSPSSTTPMEQDAIETLLTMSSPGNSQGPRYGNLPGSPLRNHFRPPERHVEFVNENHHQRTYPKPPPDRGSKTNLRTDEDVNRYLDQMSKDDESSDE